MVCCLIVLDLFSRFLPGPQGESLAGAPKITLPQERVYLSDDLYNYYLDKLESSVTPQLEEVLNDSEVVSDLDLNESSWRTDLHLYKLVAVFEGLKSFAVFTRTRIDNGLNESISIQAGQKLGGYKVDKIHGRMVVLKSDSNAVIELRLFDR